MQARVLKTDIISLVAIDRQVPKQVCLQQQERCAKFKLV